MTVGTRGPGTCRKPDAVRYSGTGRGCSPGCLVAGDGLRLFPNTARRTTSGRPSRGRCLPGVTLPAGPPRTNKVNA